MKFKFRAPLATAIAMSVGLVVLSGYFIPAAEPLRFILLRVGMVLAAVALLVGVINLLSVHIRKMADKDSNSWNSFILVVALLATLGIGFYDMFKAYMYGNPNFEWTNWIFTYIQRPIETSLMAVMAVSLVYAATYLLRRKMNYLAIGFFFIVLLVLLGSISLSMMNFPILKDIRSWIVHIPAVGGARGLLLGIALGTITTGLRIIMGTDRPYEG
ncbi:MAG: hypothetical protein MAG431_00499 [Chloroflexi bacterium]|nr:hypothetical protein [Chloroflexota bacterium]